MATYSYCVCRICRESEKLKAKNAKLQCKIQNELATKTRRHEEKIATDCTPLEKEKVHF